MTHVTCRLTAKNRDQLRNPIRSVIAGYLLLGTCLEWVLPLAVLSALYTYRTSASVLLLFNVDK